MQRQLIKGVLFDMDGLLVDTERVTLEACRYAGERCGATITDDFYGSPVGKGGDDSEKELFRQFGPDFPLDRFMALVNSKMRLLLMNNEILKKGAREIVEFTHKQKIPAGLVTSSHHDDVHERLKSMVRYFTAVVTREDVIRGKPAPDLYLEAIHRLKIDPDKGIGFEDSPAGAQAALRAGLNVVIVPDLVEPEPELKKKVLAVCDDLFEAREFLASLTGIKN